MKEKECTEQGGPSQELCCCRLKDQETRSFFRSTYEKIHDSTVLKKLVSHVLDNHDKKKIKSVVADGAHDINRNLRFC
jgi:hypothetical protein